MIPQIRPHSFWIKVVRTACALVALLVLVSTDPIRPAAAQSGGSVKKVTVPAPKKLSTPRLASPPALSDAERTRLQAAETNAHPRGPVTRAGARSPARVASPTAPTSAPRGDVRTAASQQSGRSVNAPGDFVLYRKADLFGIVNGHQSLIDEPSAANVGTAVLETGDWYAAVSSDGGSTFSFINPSSISNGPLYSGFLGNQNAIYDPSRKLVLWNLLYQPDVSGNNTIGLAIFNGEASLESTPLAYNFYNGLTPQLAGFPAGESFDNPQISLSSSYLYISANVFKNGLAGPFDASVVMRLPLDGLAAAGALSFDIYVLDASHFNPTLAQGATTTMYFASQSDTATMRVYQWAETAAAPSATDVAHTAYPAPLSNYANFTCPINGIQDWCGRLDDRVQTGGVSGNLVGFMWTAPAGTGEFTTFAFPYVQTLWVNRNTMTLAGESWMYNPGFAYAYPAAAVNFAGHVAGSVFYGGGTLPPTSAAFIWDNFSSTPFPIIPSAWDVYTIAASTQGPTGPSCSNCWGDYLAARPDHTSFYTRYLWVATGFNLQSGGADGNVHPYYLRFGRAAYDPAIVQANYGMLFLPVVENGQ